MGSERAIDEGSGAPKSLFAKASVGTERRGDVQFTEETDEDSSLYRREERRRRSS